MTAVIGIMLGCGIIAHALGLLLLSVAERWQTFLVAVMLIEIIPVELVIVFIMHLRGR
jgi:hypothetical protein